MTPQERLAAALDVDFGDCWIDEAQPDGSTISTFDRDRLAAKVLAADPTLAQDIADGQAMRQLREALPDGWQSVVILTPVVLPIGPDATIAEAADACRKALEASRG